MATDVNGMRQVMVINTVSPATGTPLISTPRPIAALAVEVPRTQEPLTMARLRSTATVSSRSVQIPTMEPLTPSITIAQLTLTTTVCVKIAGTTLTSMHKTCVAHVAEVTERNVRTQTTEPKIVRATRAQIMKTLLSHPLGRSYAATTSSLIVTSTL